MTGRGGRWLPVTVLVVAVLALVGTMVWVGSGWSRTGWSGDMMTGRGSGPGPMHGVTEAGTGPVRTLEDADRAAQRFADRWGLRVGEVMEFENGYYAELVDSSGAGATEVLVDRDTGGVRLEYGPAMMWNTRYGRMHGAREDATGITPGEARRIADRWLRANATGLRAGEAETFPGYYTLHTKRGDRIAGMMSVHAGSGEVWYHTWHGEFVRMREPGE